MIAQLPYTLTSAETALACVLILLFLTLNALLHAAEAGVASLRRVRIEELEAANDPSAGKLRSLYESQQAYFATCQVGFQFARLGIVAVCFLVAPAIAERFGGAQYSGTMLFFTLLMLLLPIGIVNLLFAELMFRSLGKKKPEKWAGRLHRFLRVCRWVFAPAVWIVRIIGSLIMKRLGFGEVFGPQIITEEEIVEIVTAGAESSELIEDERQMIHSIIEFTNTVAREIMTPRIDINACDVNDTPEMVADLIKQTGHTRIPVYKNNIDTIVGIVHAKDLLQAIVEGNGCKLSDIARPPYFIPESKSLHELLTEFRRGRTQMAIVQDEYGGTSGLVTIEDVVEEIVGDIVDEYDTEEQPVVRLDDGSWLIQGKLHLWDVNEAIGSHFESEEFDTIGGLLFGMFGRQPEAGDVIDSNGWTLKVVETDGRRVLRINAKRNLPVASEGA